MLGEIGDGEDEFTGVDNTTGTQELAGDGDKEQGQTVPDGRTKPVAD